MRNDPIFRDLLKLFLTEVSVKRFHKVNVFTFTVVVSISLCFAQTRFIEKQGEAMFEGRPFFTDSSVYNSYDLGGSPLGLFDKGSPRFDARFGYRSSDLGGWSGQRWNAPTLTMGNPGTSFFQVFYGPHILSDKNGGNDVSLPLHRFGLVGATQASSGAIRAAFSVTGFYGDQEWDVGNEERMIGGVERLRLDIGSRLHPLLRLGLFVSGDVKYEEINITRQHRSCQTDMPVIGANLDVGGEDFPVRGNLDFSYAWNRFVYTRFEGDNANAIRNDSLNLFLTTQASLSPLSDDKLVIKPGLILGLTNNSGEQREPEAGNNYPINLGGAIPNSQYGLMGFWFGAGAGFGVFGYVDAYVEYMLAAMSLDCESGYAPPPVKSRTLHYTSFGLSTSVNKYVEMPIVINPRLAYFISGMSRDVGGAYSRLGLNPLNPRTGNGTNDLLYNPQSFLSDFAHISGFTIGVDGQALEGQVEASVWAAFLSSSAEDKGGLEFGVKVGFLLK